MRAVAAVGAFTPNNDLYGEHDCATLDVAGYKVIFKFDYYDAYLRYRSGNPADESVTRRVMTVMLVEEH